MGAETSRRKCRPIAAQAAELHAGRINQPNAIADLPPIAGLQLSHQGRKQACKDLHRTRSIGSRERRSRYRAAAEMVKLAGVTLQARFNLAQTPCAATPPLHHPYQPPPCLHHPPTPPRSFL